MVNPDKVPSTNLWMVPLHEALAQELDKSMQKAKARMVDRGLCDWDDFEQGKVTLELHGMFTEAGGLMGNAHSLLWRIRLHA